MPAGGPGYTPCSLAGHQCEPAAPCGQRAAQHRDPGVVAHLYREICNTLLVKYDHPLPISCPAAFGDGTYHLRFSAQRRTLPRATEQDEGCQFLWIAGHRNWGFGWAVLYLPPAVPRIEMPRG